MHAKPSMHRFVWFDLMTTDLKGAVAFYTELFGWKTQEMDMGPGGIYTMLKHGEQSFGGIMGSPPGAPSHWAGYVLVESVDAALGRVTEAGGTIMMPATDIPDVGRFAFAADNTGAAFAVLQLKTVTPEADGPPAAGSFCWSELITSQTQHATKFYEHLFGWTAETGTDTSDNPYIHFKRGAHGAGGMMKPPQGANMPAAWLHYVASDDIDQTVARAEKLGGKVMMKPMDIPTVGRFAVLTDPQGAAFALYKSSPR